VANLTLSLIKHDILGNRTWRDYSEDKPGAIKYVWDDVNRVDRMADEATGAAYKYRADGMRRCPR
jgi:hypothetical protein